MAPLAMLRKYLAPSLMMAALGYSTLPAASQVNAAESKSKPNIMLILDSSRSMWGQINGVNKVVSARNAIGVISKQFADKMNFGLVSYGHRLSTGCKDVELLLQMAPYKASKISSTVNLVKPKGSTPISASLIKAAKAARYKKQRTNLILLADGLDNCKANPCDTAADLQRQGNDLTIHAIAFDAKSKTKLTALKCLADITGGTFSIAKNETELTAGLSAAFKAATTTPMPKIASIEPEKTSATPAPAMPAEPIPAAPISAAKAPQPAPAMPTAKPTKTAQAPQPVQQSDPITTGAVPEAVQQQQQNPATADKGAAQKSARSAVSVPVTLSARTVDGGAIIKSGLIWWVYENKKTKDGKYELVDTFQEPTPTAALKPGSYRIAAAYGMVNLIKDIDVERGRALQEFFILNAGGLRLGAINIQGGPIAPNSVRYDLFADETETDQSGNRKLILKDAKPGVVLRLNAGSYHVVSTYGGANAVVRADVTVEPGRLTDATINHRAAKITLKLVTQSGGEALANTQWNILTPGGDVVKESAGALPTHILAAGNYSVLARHNNKSYTREFSIESGDSKQIEVVIQ